MNANCELCSYLVAYSVCVGFIILINVGVEGAVTRPFQSSLQIIESGSVLAGQIAVLEQFINAGSV